MELHASLILTVVRYICMVDHNLPCIISLACDSSCTGLNQCYGSMADQCCSYNDGGNCVADCGMNREGNSTFHCVCSNFWTGANCDGMLHS